MSLTPIMRVSISSSLVILHSLWTCVQDQNSGSASLDSGNDFFGLEKDCDNKKGGLHGDHESFLNKKVHFKKVHSKNTGSLSESKRESLDVVSFIGSIKRGIEGMDVNVNVRNTDNIHMFALAVSNNYSQDPTTSNLFWSGWLSACGAERSCPIRAD